VKKNKSITRYAYWKLKMRIRIRVIRVCLAAVVEWCYDTLHSRLYPKGTLMVPMKFNSKTQEYDKFYSYAEYKKIVESSTYNGNY
jgi:hypothetical protein